MFAGNDIKSPAIWEMGVRPQLLFTHESTPIWHRTFGLSNLEETLNMVNFENHVQACRNIILHIMEYRMAPMIRATNTCDTISPCTTCSSSSSSHFKLQSPVACDNLGYSLVIMHNNWWSNNHLVTPLTSTLCPPDVIHVIGVPRPSLLFTTLPLLCIILNANQRA